MLSFPPSFSLFPLSGLTRMLPIFIYPGSYYQFKGDIIGLRGHKVTLHLQNIKELFGFFFYLKKFAIILARGGAVYGKYHIRN